jgi:ElaB/YqjD/DUF883 family membrane-anchored ribosome-binding protein
MRSAERAGEAPEAEDAETLGQAIRAGSRAASKQTTQVRNRVLSWRDTVQRETQENPLRTVGVAIGAGYLLGGGLFSALTARVVSATVRIGLRLAVIPLVTQSLASLTEGFFGSRPSAEDHEPSQTRGESRNGRRPTDQKETNS